MQLFPLIFVSVSAPSRGSLWCSWRAHSFFSGSRDFRGSWKPRSGCSALGFSAMATDTTSPLCPRLVFVNGGGGIVGPSRAPHLARGPVATSRITSHVGDAHTHGPLRHARRGVLSAPHACRAGVWAADDDGADTSAAGPVGRIEDRGKRIVHHSSEMCSLSSPWPGGPHRHESFLLARRAQERSPCLVRGGSKRSCGAAGDWDTGRGETSTDDRGALKNATAAEER